MPTLLEYAQQNDSINVNVDESGELFILKYKSLSVDWNDSVVRLSRGLVVDRNGNIVARPFDKFFNLNETVERDDLDEHVRAMSEWKDGPFTATEKLDGAMISAFRNPFTEKTQFVSSGAFDSPEVDLAYSVYNGDPVIQSVIDKLVEEYTLIFEVVAPTLLKTIPYEENALILIGARNKNTDELLNYTELLALASSSGLPVAKQYTFQSKEELLEFIKQAEHIEGLVIQFEDRSQVKIKTPTYLSKYKTTKPINGRGEINTIFLVELFDLSEDFFGELTDNLAFFKTFESGPLLEVVSQIEELGIKLSEHLQLIDQNEVKVKEWLPLMREVDLESLNELDTVSVESFTLPVWYVRAFISDFDEFNVKVAQVQEVISPLIALDNPFAQESVDVLKRELAPYSLFSGGINPKSFIFRYFEVKPYLREVISHI